MNKETLEKKNAACWKRQLRRLPWLLLIPLGLLLPQWAAQRPALVEAAYSQAVYPVAAGVLGFLSGLLPGVSIAELLLYALGIGLPALLIAHTVRLILRRIPPARFVGFLITLCILLGALLNAFYLCWGFNYSRPTLSALLKLEVRARPQAELEALTLELAGAAGTLREQAAEDEAGVFQLAGSKADCLSRIPDAYAALGRELPLFSQRVYPPKPVLSSEAMSWAGISGIFIPFTGEANVNVHQPTLLIPVSAAHEAAHAIGIARENEANFAGYLACMASGDTSLQYSAVMLALINCGNQLYAADPDAYRAVYRTYSEAMRRDLTAYNAYWDAYEGPVEEAMSEMNDSYLKHNRQESGVKSYGEMVDLLLAWHEARPVLA